MTRSRSAALVLLALFAAGMPAAAQDFRGGIRGTVSDSTGGVLPGVTVTVTNAATGVGLTVVTDDRGLFEVLYLNGGVYTVKAELSGFKTVVRANNEVRVGDVLQLALTLSAGGVQETVQVTAETSMLNTTTGISGTTVDAKQIAELPLGDGTAYMLTRLAPGIADSSDLHFARPADNGNLAGITANGVQGGNEFTIDGAPNMSNARGVGFSPPSDAIAQFKVQTNAFDAQTGHTAGAVVNLALKSGTNAFRLGSGYFNRNDSRSSTPLLTIRAGGTKPTREYNRYTGTLSGPIVKNKTFFMASFEHLRDVQPEPASYTVPTEKMRAGDFSEFTTQVFDPATVTSAGARTAFAGNVIPAARISPVAAAYAALYPLPNKPGVTVGNYFTNQLRPYDYDSGMGRIDHNFSSGNRLFGTTYWNKRREDRYNWAQDAANATNGGAINGFLVTKGFDYRSNVGVTGGYTSALSSRLLFDLRTSWARFGESRDPAQEFDPMKLGFASSAQPLFASFHYLPLFTFGSFSTTNENSTIASLGARRSDWGNGFSRPMDTLSVTPTLTKIWGEHTARLGYDWRWQKWNIVSDGFPGGRFQFNGAYTRATNSAALNDRAQSWAQFLLGLPTAATGAVATPGTSSSQFEIASPGEFHQMYHGLFAQDDWRVSPKLTLNLGLRLEINGGMSEVHNRNLGGFDTTSTNPIEAAAVAAYAASPIPQIPVSAFKVKGGLLFADGPVNKTVTKAMPRAGFSYLLNNRTNIRGGFGLFSYDYFFENINQAGFSQSTPVLVTTDNGITFTGATLANPLPGGQLVQPVGSALGLRSQLGQNLGTLYAPDREAAYYRRWEVSVQRDWRGGWVSAFTYIGSRGVNLPVARQTNNIPMAYLSTSRSRDTATESLLSATVTSPFAGLLPGSTLNGASVARSQLLRPFPEFGTFAIEEYTGSDRYDAATVQIEKRFTSGNSLTAQYTRSSLHDKLNFLNPQDGVLDDRVSPSDRPNRFSIGTSLRLPFGHHERFGKGWNRAVDTVLGGWQLSGTYQYQDGFPLSWGSQYYDASCGDPKALVSRIGQKVSGGIAGLDVPAWDVSCFYFHDAAVQTAGVDTPALQRADQRIQLGNNVRYFPSTLPHVRTDNLHLLDLGLYKNFRLAHGMKLQVRMEAINALNYTVLWNPDTNPRNATFGFINQDRNNPRDIQIGARFTF
jgi:carboxypeptidase family protein/TonB-dependent receptor-like protein